MSVAIQDEANPAGVAVDPLEGFSRLYDAEMPHVYRYIRFRVGSTVEAEDLTADVFHRALCHWPRMRDQLRSPRAWLLTMATHRLADHYRRRRLRSVFSLGTAHDLGSSRAGPEETALQHEEVSILLERLADLPERDRTVLALRFGGELSHREIGQVLGITEGASAVALLRAIRRLRQSYQGEGQ